MLFADDGVRLEITDAGFLADNGRALFDTGAIRHLSLYPCAAVFPAVWFGDGTQAGVETAAVFVVFGEIAVNGALVQFDAFVFPEVGVSLFRAVLSSNRLYNNLFD